MKDQMRGSREHLTHSDKLQSADNENSPDHLGSGHAMSVALATKIEQSLPVNKTSSEASPLGLPTAAVSSRIPNAPSILKTFASTRNTTVYLPGPVAPGEGDDPPGVNNLIWNDTGIANS